MGIFLTELCSKQWAIPKRITRLEIRLQESFCVAHAHRVLFYPWKRRVRTCLDCKTQTVRTCNPSAQRLPWFSPSSALKGAVGSAETEINHGFVYYSLLFASLRAEISSKPINVKTESETLLSIIFSIRNGTAAPLEHG